MSNLTPENHDCLLKQVGNVLHDLDADIAARKPVCQASGRCCRFDEYGHRLYVTPAELLFFTAHHAPQLHDPATPDNPGGCPFQTAGQCSTRPGRPLGCRVYFCDPAAQHWQNDLYEKYHARLRDLHTTHDLPYRYVEWRQALRELRESPHLRASHQAADGLS